MKRFLVVVAVFFSVLPGSAQTIHTETDARGVSVGTWIKLLDIEGQQTDLTLSQNYVVPGSARTMEVGSFCTGGTVLACTGAIVSLLSRTGAAGLVVFAPCTGASLGALDTSAACVVSVDTVAVAGQPWDLDSVSVTHVLPGSFRLRLEGMAGTTADNRIEVWVHFHE